MISKGRHNKLLLFVVVSAMLLMQSIAESHDLFHHHISDDCVVCKIAEVSYDKASMAQASPEVLPRLSGIQFNTAAVLLENSLWHQALSRAPPISLF